MHSTLIEVVLRDPWNAPEMCVRCGDTFALILESGDNVCNKTDFPRYVFNHTTRDFFVLQPDTLLPASKIGSIYEGTSNMQLQTIAKLIMAD